MLNVFNELVYKIGKNGMSYFIESVEELRIWIDELKDLNAINSPAECKKMYYTSQELLEIIENKQEGIEMDIYYLQCRFFDHVDIVRDKLMKIG